MHHASIFRHIELLAFYSLILFYLNLSIMLDLRLRLVCHMFECKIKYLASGLGEPIFFMLVALMLSYNSAVINMVL